MASLVASLACYLAECESFDWARFNCGHFIAGWVRRATGRDVMAGLPEAGGVRDWLRTVQAAGGVEPLVTARLGCSPIAPAFAAIGDLVLLPGAVTGGTLGLCAGRTAVCLAEPFGTAHVPMSRATAAWRLAEVRG